MSQWREAIRSKTDYAAARYNLAVMLDRGETPTQPRSILI